MTIQQTPLYGRHEAWGARLVEFGGFLMPLQYAGILEEHRAVRTGVGVFDVSHMGEVTVRGPQALDFVQFLITNDAGKLALGQVLYSPMCYPDGGTVDDLLVYHRHDHYLLVVNAANTDKDFDWIEQHAGAFEVEVDNVSARMTQLAVQGPRAQATLSRLLSVDLNALNFFRSLEVELYGEQALLSRTGYTGEDGFEVYGPAAVGCQLWDALLDEYGVAPIGLGARDSLRFEACLSLYGHELERDISPVEAGLKWAVKDKPCDYLGKRALLSQKQNPPRRLVGLKMVDPGVARQGYALSLKGKRIGTVTSGMKAPTLGGFYALALVERALELGTVVEVDVRGKAKRAEIVPRPFYTHP